MKMNTLVLAVFAGSALNAPGYADDDWEFGLDVRLRFEAVEQTGKQDAEALTLRTRARVTSPLWSGVQFLGEIEDVRDFGVGERNSGLNGQSQFATIKDDDNTELQRFQLTWTPQPSWRVTAGRQNLSFDNNRFVGSPGWRQDKTTHDALEMRWQSEALTARYVYHWQVNRGPGEEFDWDTDTHLAHLAYQWNPDHTVAGFAYLIDLTDPLAPRHRSNATWGVRANGRFEQGEWTWSYQAMFVHQTDYGSASDAFDLGYWGAELGIARDGWSARVGLEEIEGDGQRSVANPLAANHGVAGWADATHGGGAMGPADGLSVRYVGGGYRHRTSQSFLQSVAVGFTAWTFDFERTGLEFGEELDLYLNLGLTDRTGLSFQFADFDGVEANGAAADRQKSWVFLTYRY